MRPDVIQAEARAEVQDMLSPPSSTSIPSTQTSTTRSSPSTCNDSQTAYLPLSVSEAPRVRPSDSYSVPSVPRRCQIASRPRIFRLLSPSDTSRQTAQPLGLSSSCPQAVGLSSLPFASLQPHNNSTTLRAPSLGPCGPPAVASFILRQARLRSVSYHRTGHRLADSQELPDRSVVTRVWMFVPSHGIRVISDRKSDFYLAHDQPLVSAFALDIRDYLRRQASPALSHRLTSYSRTELPSCTHCCAFNSATICLNPPMFLSESSAPMP
ncbi:hypothetical protein C8Q74DRAFT_528506 [Fomes fomentarius]|nr:hypothetical protein C8Q74DRAFT_528506 [Fomes fomentarius]